MPRAFLITHRRYNGAEEEFHGSARDYSPERAVRLMDYSSGQALSDGASECGSETSSECPEELYNLTKLAEVSLAAAAGTLIHPSNVIYQRPISPRCEERVKQQETLDHRDDFGEDRARYFFERIESEREILENHRHSHHRNDARLRIPTVGNFDDEGRNNGGSSPVQPTSASSVSKSKRTAMNSPVENGKSEDTEDHECPDCGKKYSTSSNLARHRQTHRSLGDKKARRCPHCDKIYVSMPAFSMHVRTHNQGCKCHYCGKCFSRPWLLQGHIRTHTGEKPFKCTICNKAFADKSNLRAHIQTHSNTKPHVCGRCGKAFALKSYLYKHEESSCMRAHHRASSENGKVEQEQKPPLPTTTSSSSSSIQIGRQSAIGLAASPTSVIVPRPTIGRDQRNPSSSAFSAIIRHTRSSDEQTNPSAKRPHSEKVADSGKNTARESEFEPQMVIRTSVISPNPEHLGRYEQPKKPTSAFDFVDSARSSAFSRPATMTLNLAIA